MGAVGFTCAFHPSMNPPCALLLLGLSASFTVLFGSESYAEQNDRSTEFRLGLGLQADNTVAGDEGGGPAVNASLLWELSEEWVLGPTVQHAPNIFGGANTHGGLALGNTGHGSRFWQLLLETGLHHRSGIGESIFTSSDAESVDLLYVGATARWVFDIGEPGGLRFDVSLSGKRDVGENMQEVRTESCFLGCVDEEHEFVTGGWHIVGGIGFAYQFSK